MTYYAKGHTGFPGTFTATTGTSGWGADERVNTDLNALEVTLLQAIANAALLG